MLLMMMMNTNVFMTWVCVAAVKMATRMVIVMVMRL